MKPTCLFIVALGILLSSCSTSKEGPHTTGNWAEDSLALVEMVHKREAAMKVKDIAAVMTQFSEDATFINSSGYYFANKAAIEAFHNQLTHQDTIGYYYKAGKVHVRMLDSRNALVYYPWRMNWYHTLNPKDTLEKEVGLMTLSAQKRKGQWLWVAITNQHTPEYFDDLEKNKK